MRHSSYNGLIGVALNEAKVGEHVRSHISQGIITTFVAREPIKVGDRLMLAGSTSEVVRYRVWVPYWRRVWKWIRHR